MTDYLYSPWRLQYILSEKEKGCIFCIKPHEKDDQKNLILYRSSLSFVIMNLYPYNNGHLMHSINGIRVIPEAFETAFAKIKEGFDKISSKK